MKYGKPQFSLMQRRILDIARAKVRNGEFTERGLARHLGISQPHMHNLLAGVRPLTAPLLDLMLQGFEISLLDLFSLDELRRHMAVREKRGS